MFISQLLMVAVSKSIPLITLFCKSESVSMPVYYDARLMAARLSKCYDTDSTAGPASEDARGHLR